VTQPAMYSHHTVTTLMSKVSAKLYKDSAYGDWSFATVAPTLIGSFGTFTWMAAFLSEGKSIHLPYISSLEHGAYWFPLQHLFIHDDPRITYHDVQNHGNITFEKASEVLARDTVFSRAVKNRIDPCPGL
jgi:hypothetical protein